MIAPERLYNFLKQEGISFFTGVPDSLLKDFLKYLQDNCPDGQHIITANEGLAVALASGYYFQTGKMPVVYLQNSGLGNLINPLTSLADKEMYEVPMLLLIGWRGRPGIKDEPQHLKMGRITTKLLEALEVPVFFLEANETSSLEKISEAIRHAQEKQMPVALLVKEQVFDVYNNDKFTDIYKLERESVIRKIIDFLNGSETVICTTGKTGREFYEQNTAAGNKVKKYLLSVGAMGHASHIALGINISSGEKVIMLDGDGALLMHLGSLSSIAHYAKGKFIHIVLNNGSHESVGGQPTEAFRIDCCAIAKACGYNEIFCITNEEELINWLQTGLNRETLQFVEIRINHHSRANLGRPAGKPADWKNNFMSS
jgi:phosphonopyruvate decarboxylase